jgi:hypothetical protein
LALVLGVVPAGVWSVKNDGDAHRAARSTDRGCNASPALLLRDFQAPAKCPHSTPPQSC